MAIDFHFAFAHRGEAVRDILDADVVATGFELIHVEAHPIVDDLDDISVFLFERPNRNRSAL